MARLVLPASPKVYPPAPSDFQISQFHTPEIQTLRGNFNSHIPTVWSLNALPNHHTFHCPARGQIRESQMLLQFEFLRAHQQAAVRANHSCECWLVGRRAVMFIARNHYRYARIHTRSAPSWARSYISWEILSITHSGWVPAYRNETRAKTIPSSGMPLRPDSSYGWTCMGGMVSSD